MFTSFYKPQMHSLNHILVKVLALTSHNSIVLTLLGTALGRFKYS